MGNGITAEQLEAEGAAVDPTESQDPQENSAGEQAIQADGQTEGAEPAEGGQTEPEVNHLGRPYYTPEEMASVDPGELDSSRIPPALQPYAKVLQGGYSRKIGSITREFQELKQELARKEQQRPPADVYEWYDRDPESVMKDLNSRIAKADHEGDLAAKSDFLNLKMSLVEHGMRSQESKSSLKDANRSVRETIYRAIPDFQNKSRELEGFAREIGVSDETLKFITDPGKVPSHVATELTLAMNALYDRNAIMKGGVAQKKPLPAPTHGSPAAGRSAQDPAKKSLATFEDTLKRAQSSGTTEDWAAHFAARSSANSKKLAKR